MAVTSTTLAGVNVWQFSGAVTDAEIKTAWAALIVNQRYKPGRYIYVDSTCSLANVRGTYYVDCEALGIILHSSRNKANTLFKNWIFTQTAGLSVGARSNFVRVTNGTTVTTTLTDGIDMQGGGMIYAVQGNPGGGDPRYLNEMMFGTLDGTIITSQAFTEQELQPVSYGTIWRSLNIQKCANIPIVNSGNQVVYRTNFNTESTIANPISLYSGACGCFVSTVMRKQGLTFTTSLANTYGSTGTTNIVILNNWKDESYFGASKTTIVCTNWNAGNKIWGGVLKKILVQPSTLIRTYDSRSTTASQKSTFSETTTDFLSGTDSTTADATTGKASIVCVGAIATGGSVAITRYTGQKFTLQKFGYKVQIETPDMTFGDDDLSAFSPITMSTQDGIVRTQAAINAATTINSFQDLLEELHVLAIAQVGAASYNGYNSGNLFNYSGGVLTTNFASVTVDATAASKISYNSTTNALTIKSSVLTDTSEVTSWNNSAGTVTLSNGAQIQGIYQSSAGQSTIIEQSVVTAGSSIYVGNNATGITKQFQSSTASSAIRTYFAPNETADQLVVRELFGFQRAAQVVPLTGGLIKIAYADVQDVGISAASKAVAQAYTTVETVKKSYDAIALFRLTEQGIKLGQLMTRNGTSVDIAAPYLVRIKQDAASLVVLLGNTLYLKASSYDDDDKYNLVTLTPPATLTADTNEVITVEIQDANGDSSLTIQGGSGSNEVWKVPDGTAEDDYATAGTKLADVSTGKWRFTGTTGYYLLVRDKVKNNRDTASMAKGAHTIGLYAGKSQITVAELPEVYQLQDDMAVVKLELGAIQGSGFTKDAHSLVNIKANTASLLTTLAAIPQAVWEYATRVLTSAGANGVTLAEIEASEVLAKQASVQAVKTELDGLVIPSATDNASAVRSELAAELARVDVAVSSRSSLAVSDIPAGLTMAQADQLAALPTLAAIEASTELAKQASLDAIKTELDGLVIPSAIDNASAVRSELAAELARVDVAVSSRSSLAVSDIPAGLTAAQVWDHDLEATFSAAELMRLNSAVLVGKVSGAGTPENRFVGVDGETLRVVSRVDNAGNRTQVVLDSD